MQPSLFLSHTSADKPFARRLAADLKLAGARVWIDEAEMRVGDSLVEKIGTALREVDYVGVILSPEAVKSPWVKKELQIAIGREFASERVIVLPLLYRSCAIPAFLEGTLYADFRAEDRYGEAFDKIKDRLGLSEASRRRSTTVSDPPSQLDRGELAALVVTDKQRPIQTMRLRSLAALKTTFPWRMATAMLIGYLLATVPQVILDARLVSHVTFHQPRTYPLAPLIVPLAAGVFFMTLIVCVVSKPNRAMSAILPFLVACVASVPIFWPEIPHGNLKFVCVAWSLLGGIATWIHDTPIGGPSIHKLLAVEQMSIWKAFTLVLVAAYVAIIVPLMRELHAYNQTIVRAPADLFLLNQYIDLEIALMSTFMFVGPIYEAAMKVTAAGARAHEK